MSSCSLVFKPQCCAWFEEEQHCGFFVRCYRLEHCGMLEFGWNLWIKVKFVYRYLAVPQEVGNVLIEGTVSINEINTFVTCCRFYAKNVN
jgi:hypothetical protein